MKKYFVIIVILFLPFPISAAYNTVQFTEITDIYLGNGLTLQVLSGSNVAEMTVGSTSVTFDMESGSAVTVRSYDKKYLTNNLGIHTSCLENYSQVSLFSNTTQSFSITPDFGGRCEESSRSSQILSPVSPLEEDGKEEETVAEKEVGKEVGEGEIPPGEAPPEEKVILPREEAASEPEAMGAGEGIPAKKGPNVALILGIIAVIVFSGVAAYYFLKKKI